MLRGTPFLSPRLRGLLALGVVLASSVMLPSCKGSNDVTQNNTTNTTERLCAEGQHRCSGDDLERCNDAGSGWEFVQACVPATCKQGATSCLAPECEKNSDCESGICLPLGDCEPANVTFNGSVQRYEDLNASLQSGVVVSATNIVPDMPTSEPSDEVGHFLLEGIPPESLVDLELKWDDQTSPIFLPLPLRQTRIATDARGGSEKTFNPPVVSFAWLAQTAFECGLFASAEEASTTDGAINPYFIQRSTVLGEIRDTDGKPVAGITADDIEVRLTDLATDPEPYSNTHENPDDTSGSPAHVCFLEADSTGKFLKGGTGTATTDVGRFIMFRVRNPKGTGFGLAEVNVQGYPTETVSFRSSGQLGVVQIGDGEDFKPQPERPRDFETDVYPLFGKYGCRGCHAKEPLPGIDNPGYVESVARGDDKLKADYSGTPDEVYAVLMAGAGPGCGEAANEARVCVEAPEASLLATKPFVEASGSENHQTGYFESEFDPDYRAIVEWIKQGAKR